MSNFLGNSSEQIKYCNLLKISAKETYKTYKSIYCRVLNEKITFNSVGFRHLIYKTNGRQRKIKEIIYKLTLLPLAIPVIKNAIRIDSKREILISYSRKKNKKLKKGRTFSLSVIVGKKKPVKIRVIILRIGDGKYIFYSIMKD